MFSGYNLSLSDNFFKCKEDFSHYKNLGEEHLTNEVYRYKKEIANYINKDEINGSRIQRDCFPEIEADIFISHSHNDVNLANALAGWIHETFGLKVFIDSNVWIDSNKLLDDLNTNYSDKREELDGSFVYDYKSCNDVSKHVNIMLSIALQKMIDKTECVILLNTNNSIKVFDEKNKKIDITYSPWIYSEIICTQIARKKPLLLYRDYKSAELIGTILCEQYINMKIFYDISLNHLIEIKKENLIEWKNEYEENEELYIEKPLDALYTFTHKDELDNTKNVFCYFNKTQIEYIKNKIKGNKNQSTYESYMESASLCELCKAKICPYSNNIFKRKIKQN